MEPKLIHGYNVIEDIPYNQGMPILVSKGLHILSFKDLIQDIVEAHESKDHEKRDFLLKYYKDTSTACPHYDNTFGILHDFESLLNINKNTPLVDRALQSTKEEYKQLMKQNKDYFLNRNDLIIGRGLDEQEALESKVWFLLSGRNKELHKNLVKIRYSLSPKGSKLMGIYLQNDKETPEMRAWFLGGFGYGSDANARNYLDVDSRLLGVPQKNLDQVFLKTLKEKGITTQKELEQMIKFYEHNKPFIK